MAASYVHYGVHGVLLVPILLGLVAGLSPPLVCRRDWQKVVFNGGAHAVTGACAAGCVSAVVALLGDRSGALLLAAAASVAVHWLVLNGLLGWLFAALEGSRMTRLYWQLLTTDRFLIALGVLGGAGGILWAEGRAEFGLALVALTAMGPRTAAAIQQRTRIARRASGSSFLRRRASRAPEDAETIVGVVMAELWADRAAELLVEARAAGEDTTLGDGDRPS